MKVTYEWDGSELVFRSDDPEVGDWRANPKDYSKGSEIKRAYREWAPKPVSEMKAKK